MTTKQFKRTQIEVAADYKTLKAPQAVIVLKAIDELQTFDLKQLDEKCIELGLVTNSKRGVRMVADWYRRIFKEDGLVVEIKVEKPAKSEPRNKKQANQNLDTKQTKKSKSKAKKFECLTWESVCLKDKYELKSGEIIEIFDMGEDDGEPYVTTHCDSNEKLSECMSAGKFNNLRLMGSLIK